MVFDNNQSQKRPRKNESLVEAVVDGVQDATLVEKRREQICDAALELFLQKGFDSTTIRDICAKSGVNQASIYDYVANKNDILRRLLNRLWFRKDVPTLAERLAQDSDVSLHDNIAAFFRDTWSKKRQGAILAYRSVPYLQEDDRKAMRTRDTALIEELAGELRKITNLKEGDPRAEVTANLIVFIGAFAPMRDWLTRDIDNELMLETVTAGVVAMLEHLAETSSLEVKL